jgi:hypothetical protein
MTVCLFNEKGLVNDSQRTDEFKQKKANERYDMYGEFLCV